MDDVMSIGQFVEAGLGGATYGYAYRITKKT